ncbi:MAG: hypothetical protein IJS27_01610, partial [Ruminococcus sp.]|nr:hypothetical protein [Ruminococcus sp.]
MITTEKREKTSRLALRVASPQNLSLRSVSGILRKVGKTKEAVKNCLKMVRVTGLEPVRQR